MGGAGEPGSALCPGGSAARGHDCLTDVLLLSTFAESHTAGSVGTVTGLLLGSIGSGPQRRLNLVWEMKIIAGISANVYPDYC